MNNKRHKYTLEEIDFVRNNVEGINLKELTDKFNKKFNYSVTVSSIQNLKHRYSLKSGINAGCFEKGNIPFNKGTKGLTKSNVTSFKKGNIPKNHRPLWSERTDKDGYIQTKVAEPNKWDWKHRYIYEQKYGEIPKGFKVIFADGNNRNFDIGNLVLVANGELAVMNTFGLCKKNPEITKTKLNLAKMIMKTNKLKRSE